MSEGIIIHVSVGEERRTEYFGEDVIRLGSDEQCELQIHSKRIKTPGVWLQLALEDGAYRVTDLNEELGLEINGAPLKRFTLLKDGDDIALGDSGISFSFFSLTSESSLITTNRDPHVAPFIEDAALEAAATEKRDDAKAFLREFSKELLREVSWTTKLIALAIVVAVFSSLFYLGYGFYQETLRNRELVEDQNRVIGDLTDKIAKTNDELTKLDKSNKDMIRTISLAPSVRDQYGNGVCLILGVYDLVDRRTNKMLRYPDLDAFEEETFSGSENESGIYEVPGDGRLTTEGNGTPLEYDFIGTGFHVGNGYIVTNRHVIQPWTEDDLVKQLMREANGKPRIKRLVAFFPGFVRSFPLTVRTLSSKEDVAIGTVKFDVDLQKIPVLPLETDNSETVTIGKTVVTMGYPNGPDRLLALEDEEELKQILRKYGNSRQALINYLSQTGKIVPLTTQGAITDLDGRRIVHDAKTAEGGSGAPLFGQSGKVIGVNFGVFTDNNASNLAVPIKFAVSLLETVGWNQTAGELPEQTASNDAKPKN